MHVDQCVYYFHVDEFNLKQVGLDLQYILAFLVKLKNAKPGGKYNGVYHMSKFYDATKGSVLASQCRFTNFCSKPSTFLATYK